MCNVKIFPPAKCTVLLFYERSLELQSCNAIHIVPSFLLEGGEGVRDDNDDANGKNDRCRHNAPALPTP